MSGSQQLLLGGAQAVPVDPYFYSVTSLLHGDGTNGAQNNTFLDSSTNNFTITRNGNTTQGSFSPFSQTGWGNYFDGTGDTLTVASNAAFGFGTGDFTVELWVYCAFNSAVQEFIDARTADTAQPWVLGINGTGVARTYDGSTVRTGGQLAANAWNHVAWVRASNVNTVYVNGVAGHTWTASQDFGSAKPLTIGNNIGPTNEPFTGYMSNLRIVKGTAVYTSAFTPPTTPLTAISGTSLLTCQANRFLDASTNAFAITRNGDVSVQPFSPFNPTTAYSAGSIGGSGYFDGSGDYLSVADNAAWNMGSGDFTAECWIYPTSFANEAMIMGQWSGATGGTTLNWALMFDSGNAGYLRLITSSNGSSVLFDLSTSTFALSLNTWQHIAAVRNGNTYTIYVNGISRATTTNASALYDATNVFTIGAESTTPNQYFQGYMSDVRVVKGTAVYTAAFTPPTAPLTAVTNTQLLLNYTNAGIFDNAAVADYETVGNAQISTSVKKYGTGSMSFDGTGDYLVTDAPTTVPMAFGTGDFTIEFWIYFNALGDVTIFDWRPASTNGLYPTLYVDVATNRLVYYTNTGIRISGGVTLTTGTWYHIALNRTASQTKLYVNGTQDGATYADTNSYIAVAARPTIGANGSGAGSNAINGYIDDFRISKGVGRYPYNFTPPTAEFPNIGGTVTLTADPYYDYTTLLLPGNGTNGAQNNTFLDSSTNAFSITRNGNTTQGTFSPFSQTGWGNYFDGTGDWISAPSNAVFDFSGDFTIELWFYATTVGVTYQGFCGRRQAAANFGPFSMGLNNAAVLFSLSTSGSSWALNSTGGTVAANTWNHVAFVRSGTACTAYLNGTSIITGTVSGALASSSQNLAIGTFANDGTEAFNGYISNFRVVKGTAVYTANFTPSTTPLTAITNTSLLTCQSNRFVDNSTNAFAITVNGNTSIQAFSPFNPTASWSAATNGGSGYFDGSGDYLSLSQATAMSLGTGDFTVEAWVYPTANPSSYWSIIDARGSASNIPWAAGMRLVSGALKATFFNGADIQGTITVPLNAWTHVAFARQGSTLRGFVNGVLDINTTMTTNLNVTGTQYIGAIVDPTYDTGYIADCRIVKGTAVYTAAFTPPTAPLTAVTNTQLLLNCTNAGIYDATSKNDLETAGNAQISTTQSKFGGSSMYFDGTGDWLSIPDTQNLKFGTGDFTVEAWVYMTATPSAQYAQIIGRTEYGTNADWMLQITNSRTLTWYMQGSFVATSTGTVPLNTWTHVAATRYGSAIRLFINGIVDGTATNSGSTELSSSGAYTIGADQAGDEVMFTGYIDDLRTTKGIARYTSNFTPPTTAFLTL